MKKPLSAHGNINNQGIKTLGIIAEVFSKQITKRFKKSERLGTIFFMDIDTIININSVAYLTNLMRIYNLSHLALFKTKRGFHLVCFDIFKTKNELWNLFYDLKNKYRSDYEYGHQWILRLTNKATSKAPIFFTIFYNTMYPNKILSQAHILSYQKYCGFEPKRLNCLKNISIIQTGCPFVKYTTWNY